MMRCRRPNGGLPHFSQGEIDGAPDAFIDATLRLGPDLRHESDFTRVGYADRIVRGGLPEAVARTDPRRLESDLQISRPTVARYMRLLEEVFLIKRIPGWSRNLGTRITSAPKLIFTDSGIAARLLALDAHTLRPIRPAAARKSTPSWKTATTRSSASKSRPPPSSDLRTSTASAASPSDSATTSSSASSSTPAPPHCPSAPN